MSRAHIQGFDSNPAQFERMGNPWVTKQEAQELGNSPVSRAEQRKNRKRRPFDPDYRDPPRVGRQLTPEEAKAREVRATLRLIRNLSKQARGQEVREEAGWELKPPIVQTIKPARETELTLGQLKIREIQRAEVKARTDHAAKEAEKARLKAIIAAAKSRLEHLG